MNDAASVVRRLLRKPGHLLSSMLLIFLSAITLSVSAQEVHSGRGAMSAQEIAKLATPAAVGSDAADQVCARFTTRNRTVFAFALTTALFLVIGCSGAAKSDPGTVKGTYTVVVTGTSGTGASQYQTSVNVPITIQ